MKTVQLFVTCLVDTFYPQVGEALVKVLNRLNVSVDFPPRQTCCGQPAFNAGLRSEARTLAMHTIRAFEDAAGDIILPSGSCAHMLRHNYRELFADDPAWLARAESLAARTYEFSEYLVDVLGVTDVGARWEGTLTYHPSCHLLRGLGVERQPLLLLEHVRSATLRTLPHAEECCGFGGIFSVEHAELSQQMLLRKLENLASTQAETVVLADSGCLMHIAGGLHRQGKTQRVYHLAEILANTD